MVDAVIECVYRAIDEVNELLPEEQQVAKTPSSVLVGSDGTLDSMGVINLLLELENQIQSSLGRKLSVVDLAMSSVEMQEGRLDVRRLAELVHAGLKA